MDNILIIIIYIQCMSMLSHDCHATIHVTHYNRLQGYQCSERGGYVTVEILPPLSEEQGEGQGEEERVLLRGRAVTVMASQILCKVE